MLKMIIDKLIEVIKKNKLLIILILLLGIKLIIVQVQPIAARYSMIYDDQLMVEQANSIVSGNWLGEYNSRTLTKGVFTPLFIALMYIINIPFLLGKEVFYGVACIVFTIIIRKKIKSNIALILIYIVILMNPVEYSAQLCRVYRDGIYASLILYLLAFLLGIFINRKEKGIKIVKYFFGVGIAFSATFLCREETIWLLPGILIITLATIIPHYCSKKILFYIIPIMITCISINIICALNYKYYDVYILNQYWGKAFQSAYGALLRIKPQEEKQRVPITRETMIRLYEISPKFAELENFLEGKEGDDWRDIGIKVEGELTGAYIQWALMDAVEAIGYYESAPKAEQYYIELANEINRLCDDKIIESRGKKLISNSCYFKWQDMIKIISKMPETIKYQYKLEDVNVMVINPDEIIGAEEKRKVFEKITGNSIVTIGYYFKGSNSIKIKIIEKVTQVYKFINPYLFYFSIAIIIIFVTINIKRLKVIYEEFIILSTIAIIYLSRIFVITFTKELMFEEALNTSYLACIYNMQYLLGIIAFSFLIKEIRRKYNERKNRSNIINSGFE